jgi:hypothetical protein
MALGQKAYRRNQIRNEQQITECFELHTARSMRAREVAMHLQACGTGFCSSDDDSLRKRLFIAIVRVFWNGTSRLLKSLGPDIASSLAEVNPSLGDVKHQLQQASCGVCRSILSRCVRGGRHAQAFFRRAACHYLRR